MKRKILIIICAIALAILLFSYFYSFFFFKKVSNNFSQVCIKGKCVNVEIADTDASRETGLMYRTNLCESCGMLFLFPETGKYNFWMKNTKIPLDIIWINENYTIVNIITAEPCTQEVCQSFGGNSLAKYVLEVNSGFSNKNGITLGDSVSIDIKK